MSLTDVSQWCSDTEQQQKLRLHSRKRRASSVDNPSQKSLAVKLNWSAPQSMEGTWRGLCESGNGIEPPREYEHQQKHSHGYIHAQHQCLPSSVPELAVKPAIAELSRPPLNLTQLSRSQGTAYNQQSRKPRAVDPPACQDTGVSQSAMKAKALCAASSPARLPFAGLQPDALASAPARRHSSADKTLTGVLSPDHPAPPEQACKRPQGSSWPGSAEDNISLHVISKQQGGAAGGTRPMSGRSKSAAGSAASISSTGSAFNATHTLMQVQTYLDLSHAP